MLIQIALLALGVVALAFGARLFVRGAVAIAEGFGINAFVVGVVIVGFGTSTPELAVNLTAALAGSTDIAIGNLVGSNIANVGLILALAALAMPLAVRSNSVHREAWFLVGVGLLLWALAWDGLIGRVDALILLVLFGGILWVLMGQARVPAIEAAPASAPVPRHAQPSPAQPSPVQLSPAQLSSAQPSPAQPLPTRRLPVLSAVSLAAGLALLILGGWLCVDAALAIARGLGWSELLIGLTVVAVGTSLPELAASVAAAWRGRSDIALGNVIGSCLYNALCIPGLTALIQPLPTTGATLLWLDLPVMIGFSVLLLILVAWRRGVSRVAGALLLCAYVGYLSALVLFALRGVG